MGVRAPGRFVDAIKCVVARTRTAQLHEIPTVQTKLSQYCHRCENYTRKPLSQRFHCCPHCGLGSDGLIQRDLYSAWLASVLDPIRLSFPSRGQLGMHWQSMEACLSAPWKRPENMRVRRASCAASVSPELERVGPNVLPIHTKSRLPPGRRRKRYRWRKNPCDKSQRVSVFTLHPYDDVGEERYEFLYLALRKRC